MDRAIASGALEVRLDGSGVAPAYAARLLADCGIRARRADGPRAPHPALAWARSGAMVLTGPADGPPRVAPGPLASCAQGAFQALAALAGGSLPDTDAAALLGERAAWLGLGRRGRVSPGGSCRLIRARDGWIAVGLARPDDRALVPAWLGERGDWSGVSRGVARRTRADLLERAALLGLPVAAAAAPDPAPPSWLRVAAHGPPVAREPGVRPLVVDLSALWAGPLATSLLADAGARVIKVESVHRPDGARRGPAGFFRALNAGKASVALDFSAPTGRDALEALLRRADVVVESARPRALAQLGIDVASLVAERAGLTWVSITGYGRDVDRVAFGDDAAAAAGLAAATGEPDAPLFCGDAIADPLTGLHAAVAALASFRRGGGALLDVSLRNVAAHALGFPGDAGEVRVVEGGRAVAVGDDREPVAPPRARRPRGRARPLGADTANVLGELAC